MAVRAPTGRVNPVTPDPPATNPAYYLGAHAYCCEFDDGAIILDLRGDTYLGIDAQHLSHLRNCIVNWPESDRHGRHAEHHNSSASESLIADLLARKILSTLPTVRHSGVPMNVTTAQTLAPAVMRKRIPAVHIVQFASALLLVAVHLKNGRLESLLDWLHQRQSCVRSEDAAAGQDLIRQLASFRWLRTWCYTTQRHCLFDSLVLSVYLTFAMIPCALVIGVTTKPFLAHAWVQRGASVLNDTAEHVRDFKCILSVGLG
jgi:Transglutaminase-like superfamily